jgi:hypothetical protein
VPAFALDVNGNVQAQAINATTQVNVDTASGNALSVFKSATVNKAFAGYSPAVNGFTAGSYNGATPVTAFSATFNGATVVYHGDGNASLTTTVEGNTLYGRHLDGALNANAVLYPPSANAGTDTGVALYANPSTGGIGGIRRVADISGSFTTGGQWGDEKMIFGVGVGAPGGDNSAEAITTERLRIGTASISASIPFGYRTGGVGVGGAVTQTGAKSNPVTINTPTGIITMANVALAAGTSVVFTVTNSAILFTDLVILSISGGYGTGTTATYLYNVADVFNGSFVVHLRNVSAASATDPLQLTYAIIRGSNS